MKWLYGITLIFSLLTIYFLHDEHKKKPISKKAYIVNVTMVLVLAVFSLVLLVNEILR